MRQDHRQPHGAEAAGADRRSGAARRRRRHRPETGADVGAPPPRADRVPGPLFLAQPAPDRRRHRRRAHGEFRHCHRQGAGAPGGRAVRPRRPARREHGQVSARVLRRPAPAARHRQGAVGEPGRDRRRRAGVGARRLGARAGAEPDDRPAGRIAARLPVRQPRSGRRAAHQPPHRRDVPGAHRRAGGQARAVRQAVAPVHRGAAGGRASARSHAPQAGSRDPAGRPAEPDAAAERLPVPHALRLCTAGMQGHRPAAARGGARPPRGVPAAHARRPGIASLDGGVGAASQS